LNAHKEFYMEDGWPTDLSLNEQLFFRELYPEGMNYPCYVITKIENCKRMKLSEETLYSK